MKILLSPAKTLDIKKSEEGTSPVFIDETSYLLSVLEKMSVEDLAKAMKLKGKLLENTYENIQSFASLDQGRAIESYSGMVFKNLDFASLGNKDYIKENLFILDAFYGVLRAEDLIRPYRMDFKTSLKELKLYEFWSDKVNEFLDENCGDEPVLCLASKEFSKLIKRPFIEVEFRTFKDGKYKNVATFAKMARGLCLRAMAENEVESIEGLMKLEFGGYVFNEELSDDTTLIFSRNQV